MARTQGRIEIDMTREATLRHSRENWSLIGLVMIESLYQARLYSLSYIDQGNKFSCSRESREFTIKDIITQLKIQIGRKKLDFSKSRLSKV